MMLSEIKGDYLDGLLGKFYTYYNTDKAFGGFHAPKYPDMDYTIYGLLDNGKTGLAQNLLECNLRDVVRAQRVFAETYAGEVIPLPDGVRPSIFGAAAMIDFLLLKNGFSYRDALHITPLSDNGTTGVENLNQ